MIFLIFHTGVNAFTSGFVPLASRPGFTLHHQSSILKVVWVLSFLEKTKQQVIIVHLNEPC